MAMRDQMRGQIDGMDWIGIVMPQRIEVVQKCVLAFKVEVQILLRLP